MDRNPLGITDTILRDAHQSLLATRMRIEHMLPIAEKLDRVGYHSLEVWGGATFDSCMRFLDEDPWERLRTLRKVFKNTRLQMLLRGQNIVGYRNYADDLLERFIVKAKENGMDIFRIFDALNDVRNMRFAMEVTKRVGGHAQATICYTRSPYHNVDAFVEMGRTLRDMGADSICIKDMAGLIDPYESFDLTSQLKQKVGLPVQMHCHYTSGMASMAYLKAAEAEIDVVDTSISSISMGSGQPPTESLVAALRGTRRDTGLDLDLLSEIAEYFNEVRKEYGKFEMGMAPVDTNVLTFQIPGGMISNLVSQLREQKAEDRLKEVLAEVPRVRQDLGFPPLVTPSSQMVGTQAVLNVLLGERYKMVPNEIKLYVKGFYGRPPIPVDPEVRKKIIGDEEVIDVRPADMLEPEWDKAVEGSKPYAQSEEDVISYAIFPQVALEFFKRRAGEVPAEPKLAAETVAAIAAALFAPQEQEQVSERVGSVSGWKLAGRLGMVR
ncbi:MAG: oxaloacetate decarboxylase subunit alpha [Chloroflexota bacterium]